MSFFSPWNFAWLLPLAIAIIAFWILRLRRKETTVSSLYLWQSLIQDTHANVPFQKIRRSLLLFLQLLTAFLLACALARPYVMRHGHISRLIVVVIDNSGSMSATDIKPSRLDVAKAAAETFVDKTMESGDLATVIATAPTSQTPIPLTADRDRVHEAIEDIPATDTRGGLPQAFALAQSVAANKRGALIRFFSDGIASQEDRVRIAELAFANVDVQTVNVVIDTVDNMGITSLGDSRDPATGNREIYVDIHNFGSRPHPATGLSLLKDGKLIDARELALPPGGQQSETFTGPLLNGPGLYTAQLNNLSDDLASDNAASLALPDARQRKVLLVSEGNLYLERGLEQNKGVVLDEVAPKDFAAASKNTAAYALTVFDNWLPPGKSSFPGNVLVINASAAWTPLELSPNLVDAPSFIDQDRVHPLMRFVDLDGLSLRQAPRSTLAPWARSLAESSAGPMIAVGERGGGRIASVGFDLSDSNWPLRVSFPIFLTNVIDWLAASSGPGSVQEYTPAGEAAAVRVPSGIRSVEIVRPDGRLAAVDAPPEGGIVAYNATDRAGIYQFRAAGGFAAKVAVNLLDQNQSRLNPAKPFVVENKGVAAPSGVLGKTAVRTTLDLIPFAAAIALALLLLEWIVYNRRP